MSIDYHDFVKKSTPLKDRRIINIGDIYINAVRCLKCNETIRSKNQHDFVTCSCGNISVDGGSWYLKRSGEGVMKQTYEELSENFTEIERR